MSYGGYSKQKWVKKEEPKEKAPPEPTGPSYGAINMLTLYELFKKKGIPDQFKLGYSTEERPAEAADAGDVSAAASREALREEVKKRREIRKSSGNIGDTSPSATPKSQPGRPSFTGMAMQPMWPPMPMAPMAQPQPESLPPMNFWCPFWGTEATLRLSNVPTGYKQETLAALLGVRFRGAIDFLFLPAAAEGSPETDHNCGFAFVNFRAPQAVADFTKAFNNVRVGTAFPGSTPPRKASADGEEDAAESTKKQVCKVNKAKIATLDGLVADVRAQSSSGKTVRMPVLWDYYGNVRPIPTADAQSASAAAAAAAVAAAMSAAAFSGNSYGATIRAQIEYYFSFDNMCRDVFLRSKMDEEGWVPMALIASFNKIKQYNIAPDNLGAVLNGSEVVEVDNEKKRIRQLDAKQRMIWELKGNLDGDQSKEKAEKS